MKKKKEKEKRIIEKMKNEGKEKKTEQRTTKGKKKRTIVDRNGKEQSADKSIKYYPMQRTTKGEKEEISC